LEGQDDLLDAKVREFNPRYADAIAVRLFHVAIRIYSLNRYL
jgi:hypothetical protein